VEVVGEMDADGLGLYVYFKINFQITYNWKNKFTYATVTITMPLYEFSNLQNTGEFKIARLKTFLWSHKFYGRRPVSLFEASTYAQLDAYGVCFIEL